jgi:hypothetical protein
MPSHDALMNFLQFLRRDLGDKPQIALWWLRRR